MTLRVIILLFGILALISILLRLSTRLPPFKAPFRWDDGLIIVATVCLRKQLRTRGC